MYLRVVGGVPVVVGGVPVVVGGVPVAVRDVHNDAQRGACRMSKEEQE